MMKLSELQVLTKEELLKQNFMQIESWKKYKLYDAAIKTFQTGKEERLTIKMTTTFGKNVSIGL